MSTSRRDFLSAAVTLAGASAVGSAQPPARRGGDLIDRSALEAVAGISQGEFTSEEYAGALLARCAATRSLNAFITLEPDKVLEAARECDRKRRAGARPGALFGLPIPVKDSISTQEYPTTAGTPALRHFRPQRDASIVKALREAGALVLGKTNLHELSYGWTSNNAAFGAVRNPYDPTRIAGGSSGGSAVAVAARMAPLGVGEDTNGSIRIPAALCGVCGLRPTTGRYPTDGCVPLTPLFDQVGPFARTIADLGLLDSVLTNDWQPIVAHDLKGIRLGVIRGYYYRDLDREVERLTQAALRAMQEEGVELVELEFPELDQVHTRITYPAIAHDAPGAIAKYLRDYHAGLTFDQLIDQASADIRQGFRAVQPGGSDFVTDAEYATVVRQRIPALRRQFHDHFARERLSAMVFPVTCVPALPIAPESNVAIGDRQVSLFTALARNITPTAAAAFPGLVVPAGLTRSGLPVGIELDAEGGSDRTLLALGMTIAGVLGSPSPPRL
ncbi:MAG: twin-arginine translocation signal domain-containing protein [Gammaproteobacteria bacterium]|nr:twin-arginine translocation signal domain-containing protein [Gammaproteobacteria bacterium]